jgi:hypothetical protein
LLRLAVVLGFRLARLVKIILTLRVADQTTSACRLPTSVEDYCRHSVQEDGPGTALMGRPAACYAAWRRSAQRSQVRAVHTAIGQRLKSSPGQLATASSVAALVVATDLALVWWNHYPESIEVRGPLALVAVAALLRLVQGDLPSIGLQSPVQGWLYWGLLSLLIGLAVGVCIVVGLGTRVLSGHDLAVYTTAPSDVGTALLRMCVFAPVVEETIYRLALCVPLAVWLGPWKAVVVSGLAFAALHG